MGNDAFSIIEKKLDFIAGLIALVFGLCIGLAIIYLEPWGGWSAIVGGSAIVVLPAFLLGQYRDLGKK